MRRQHDLALASLPARFDALDKRVSILEELPPAVAENTAIAKRIDESTKTIVQFVQDVDAVWRFCKKFRQVSFRLAKWITAIAVAVTSVFAAVHSAGVDAIGWIRGIFR